MRGIFLLFHIGLAQKDDRGLPERYLYEKPVCESVEQCAGMNGCTGETFTATSGEITLSNYDAEFNCRWEVKAPIGSQISIRVEKSATFGIENQASCGYDRLHIRSGYDVGYGRLCSSMADPENPYNGMADYESEGNTKIKSKFFKEWLLLDTDHLVIGFDSDRQTQGAGFKLEYRMEVAETAVASVVSNGLEDELTNLVDSVATRPGHKTRLNNRLTNLFTKFNRKMTQCKNGDQSGAVVATIDSSIFTHEGLDLVTEAWLSFYRGMFNNCELPIITNNGGSFDNTSWPRRIGKWMERLAHEWDE